MSENKLKAAQEFLHEKRYAEARLILNAIKDHPTAKKWLDKLNAVDNEHRSKAAKQKSWYYGFLVWFIDSGELRKALATDAESDVLSAGGTIKRRVSDMDFSGYAFRLEFIDITTWMTDRKIDFKESDKLEISVYRQDENDFVTIPSISEARKYPDKIYHQYRSTCFEFHAHDLQEAYFRTLSNLGEAGWQLVQIIDHFLPRYGIEDKTPTIEYRILKEIAFFNRIAVFKRQYEDGV